MAWTVRADAVPGLDVQGNIPVSWVRFSDPDEGLEWLKEFRNEPYHVSLKPTNPILDFETAT